MVQTSLQLWYESDGTSTYADANSHVIRKYVYELMSNIFPPVQPAQTQTGNVELDLPYGGDLSILPNGDLVLATDLPGNARATTQRVQRLLYTNPRVPNGTGGFISSGDDIFHPDWGVGLPNKVGKMFPGGTTATPKSQVQSLLQQIQAQAANGLAQDPSIAQNPPPIAQAVSVPTNPSQINVQITCQAVTGQLITVPASPITGGS